MKLRQGISVLLAIGVCLGGNEVVKRCHRNLRSARGQDRCPSVKFDITERLAIRPWHAAEDVDAAAVGPPRRTLYAGEELGGSS